MALEHLPEQHRYLFLVDGEEVGLTDYHLAAGSIHIIHTEITPRMRGTGLGDAMVRAVLDEIGTGTSLRVVPDCPFVADWLGHHPDYQELAARA